MSITKRCLTIADTHFGHNKMIEIGSRPSNFSEKILRNIQKDVGLNDIFIHFGDVCIGNDEFWHNLLMASLSPLSKKWLIRGNHDKKSVSWYLDHGWDCVVDRMDFKIFGLRIALSHKPLPESDSFDINIHGHFHITKHHPECKVSQKHILTHCEPHFRPIPLKTILGK